mmetsp:Transcript_47693/g.57476  ORF Transcript_47693/g.57476 Transcript_47693/m.57476 type:complete len:81 (+) Transcript_47693:795-1037(+)
MPMTHYSHVSINPILGKCPIRHSSFPISFLDRIAVVKSIGMFYLFVGNFEDLNVRRVSSLSLVKFGLQLTSGTYLITNAS